MPELATAIDAVTVFPDRARVTRRGRTALEPGEHRLEISGLPMSLLPDSVLSVEFPRTMDVVGLA